MNNLQPFLNVATEAAIAAEEVLMSYLGRCEAQEKGRPGDLVTQADKASEAKILQILRTSLPDHAIMTEESGQFGDRHNPYLWVIDPLDGTTNFAHQYPVFSVSIGLMIHGIPRVGVILDPSQHRLYQAVSGGGAMCNQQPIHVSPTSQLQHSLLVTGFAYDRRETPDNNYAEFCYLTHLTQGVRRGGSAAIDLAHIASGRLDGYWERGLCPWDIVAGIVLVQEAGGVVSAYDGSGVDIQSGRILATNGLIHSELSQALSQVKPLGYGSHLVDLLSHSSKINKHQGMQQNL